METFQALHIAVEIGILIAVIKATFTIARLEFRVELMWEEFYKRLTILEKDEE